MKTSKAVKTKSIEPTREELILDLRTIEGIEAAAARVADMGACGVTNFSSFGVQAFEAKILKRVHGKATVPEVILKFASKPEAALAISLVPIRQQRKLVSYPYVHVVRRIGDTFSSSLESIYDLTALEVQQIFSGHSTRTVEEQEDVLSNPDVDGTVKGDTRTINMHFSHADYAIINKLRTEHDMTKCAYLRAVMRGELPPPLKRTET